MAKQIKGVRVCLDRAKHLKKHGKRRANKRARRALKVRDGAAI